MSDGIRTSNISIQRVEPILDVKRFKIQFIHGLETKDNYGVELDDSVYQAYINMAISYLEHELDISIMPRTETEEKDYFGNDYWEWGYFQLNNIPVQPFKTGRDSIQITYLRDQNNIPINLLSIPNNWIRVRPHDGVLRLVPNNQFPASLQVDASGTFFPEIFRRHSNVPQLWTITYTSGFEDGKVPCLLNTAIGLLAAILAFNNSADLLLGAGIASTALSIDGISQSINSTASAENHTYSAKVKEYQAILFGRSINSPDRGVVRILKDYYQGSRMNII